MKEKVILFVDDEPVLRELMTAILRKMGFTVLEAANGKQALRVAEEAARPIELLITDMLMPEMNGAQLAQRLRAMQPNVKILFVSGSMENMFLPAGLEIGSFYIQKPFTVTELGEKVREVLGNAAEKK